MSGLCVYDCDTGSDDAWGLLMLLRAEAQKKISLLGVTCVSGNTSVENACRNTLRVLKTADRLDIPVHKGAVGPLIPPKASACEVSFHGLDGFGDTDLDDFNHKDLVHQKHAVEAMYEYAKEHPQAVTFILVGPLTNFALCLSMYADFAELVKGVFIMGGNFKGVGNATHTAEFNFHKDPEAAKIVLEKCTAAITILPWEACLEEVFEIPLSWRLEALSRQSSCPVVELLTLVESRQYGPNGYEHWCPCDAMLVAALLFPEEVIKRQSTWHVTVELFGEQTRGQMVLDHLRRPDFRHNVTLLEHLQSEAFKQVALWAAGVLEDI